MIGADMENSRKKFTSKELARLIDISAVQANHGLKEINELIACAKTYRFISVHTLPSWTRYLSDRIADCPDIMVGAPVGFPSGGGRTEVKLTEAKLLIEDGVQEMDMVINIGKLRSGEYSYVLDEIRRIREVSRDMPLKVILETYYLTEEEIKRGCELCITAGADFVKTGTGWAPGGVTIDVVRFIKQFVGNAIKVKAAGGIRNLEMLAAMYDLGVERFGINVRTSIEIIEACTRSEQS